MSRPEFSRMVDLRALPAGPVVLESTESERTALATRFGLVAIEALTATVTLTPGKARIDAAGRLVAKIVQSCAVSGENLPVAIAEPLAFRFVPEREITAEEIELAPEELDEITYHGNAFDLGEAVAQSLALAIDPYLTGPEAERARAQAGLSTPEASGPFAVLAALKKP